jgi:hypothetical protein
VGCIVILPAHESHWVSSAAFMHEYSETLHDLRRRQGDMSLMVMIVGRVLEVCQWQASALGSGSHCPS